MLFDWHVGLVFMLEWIEEEAPSNLFPTDSEPEPDKISVVHLATTG